MGEMLKADLHLHAAEDIEDNINYSAKDLIDKAAKLNFDVLAFTFHHHFFWKKDIIAYAKKKGILLIPGAELMIEGNDVLVYNISKKDVENTRNFNDLKKLKQENKEVFIIAPHPYFKAARCLESRLEQHIDLFDAIEHSWFFSKAINWNKKAIRIAKKYNKPLIATSDCHVLSMFGGNYTLIDASKDKKAIFNAIRKEKISIRTKSLSLPFIIMYSFRIILDGIRNIPKQLYSNNPKK
jgi:predicted metal-dependent phosphoesterase TrpH